MQYNLVYMVWSDATLYLMRQAIKFKSNVRQHINHPFSPDEKLGKFASAYVTAARSPANTRSLQCSTVLSIKGLSSNAIGKTVNQICTSAVHLFDTEENSLDSGCFDKQQVPMFKPDAAQGTVAAGLQATYDSKSPLLYHETSSMAGCVSLALP